MQEIQYIGEHLLPQQLGHFSIILSFVAALTAVLAYFMATQKRELPTATGWRNLGRAAFGVHSLAVFAVIGLIFYVMIQRYYEYQYVYAHVSEDLPFKYIFSAFWEGQEGSFLLWMFWHVVLGGILMWRSKRWEGPTMALLAGVQLYLASMLLGVYVGLGDEPFRIGSNPLLLLRQTTDAPIFAQADYVSLLQGTGLNPLLQNYWMTIHPPTLFLGFASTTIPFVYAIAGLWTGEHKAWLKPALPWALFSGAILGTGILMGGAWAYEALSFGGYWAWDPVENMSLVPWLTLIAGIHTNLVARSTGHSIRSTYIFYLLTFLLILYSTFLTRSGVLGETSVHAFTEMGLEWQLVGFIGVFLLLSAILIGMRYKSVPAPKKEEAVASKEFWMFIGSLVLLFSALIITASTSLPVYNKIMAYFYPGFEGRVITDPIPHYNKYQVWIAVFIGLMSGFAQFLRWREHNWSRRLRTVGVHVGIAAVISAVLTYLTSLWVSLGTWQYGVMLFAGYFTIATNIDYLITFLRGNLKAGGSVFSHVGFGLMIAGIIASGVNQNIISSNPFIMEGLIQSDDPEGYKKNIILFKDSPSLMSGYEVTYLSDTIDTYTRTYTIGFKRYNEAGEVIEEFELHPNVLYNKTFTKIAASNPSTKHYLHKDVFTHISSLPMIEMDMEFRQKREDSLNYRPFQLPVGELLTFTDTVDIDDKDTINLRDYRVQVHEIVRNPKHPDYHPQEGDLAVGVKMTVIRSDKPNEVYDITPVIVLREQMIYTFPEQINKLSTKVRLREGLFEQVFTLEQNLNYEEFRLKQGETVTFDGLQVRFDGFNRKPELNDYQAKEGDLPVGARLIVSAPGGETYSAEPLFLIRDGQPMNLKDQVDDLNFHARFTMVDPQTEQARLFFARETNKETLRVPFEVATDSLRADYIVLQAIEFPGINLFWLGTILMMLGFAISMIHRLLPPKGAGRT
jgi:cytochrome c-type biogenesis protein CcmF